MIILSMYFGAHCSCFVLASIWLILCPVAPTYYTYFHRVVNISCRELKMAESFVILIIICASMLPTLHSDIYGWNNIYKLFFVSTSFTFLPNTGKKVKKYSDMNINIDEFDILIVDTIGNERLRCLKQIYSV